MATQKKLIIALIILALSIGAIYYLYSLPCDQQIQVSGQNVDLAPQIRLPSSLERGLCFYETAFTAILSIIAFLGLSVGAYSLYKQLLGEK